jgi:hypothetical protein
VLEERSGIVPAAHERSRLAEEGRVGAVDGERHHAPRVEPLAPGHKPVEEDRGAARVADER